MTDLRLHLPAAPGGPGDPRGNAAGRYLGKKKHGKHHEPDVPQEPKSHIQSSFPNLLTVKKKMSRHLHLTVIPKSCAI